MKQKPRQVPLKVASCGISMSIRRLTSIVLGPVLALLLVAHGFAWDKWEPPPGQPEQTWSQVYYDPKLSDPFFETEEWSYPDYDYEGIPLEKRPMKPPRVRHTARCFSTSFGTKHEVRFCEAKLRGENKIDLFIHEHNPGFDDALRVQIRKGLFACQYWTYYRAGPGGLVWTTKRQKLTLDKKAYRKGDVMTGRIAIEVLDELPQYPDRGPRKITLYGVFKTIVE